MKWLWFKTCRRMTNANAMSQAINKWILNWKISHISIFSSMLGSPNHMILNFDYEPFLFVFLCKSSIFHNNHRCDVDGKKTFDSTS